MAEENKPTVLAELARALLAEGMPEGKERDGDQEDRAAEFLHGQIASMPFPHGWALRVVVAMFTADVALRRLTGATEDAVLERSRAWRASGFRHRSLFIELAETVVLYGYHGHR